MDKPRKFDDPWLQGLLIVMTITLFGVLTVPYIQKVKITAEATQLASLDINRGDIVQKEPDEPKAVEPPAEGAVSKALVVPKKKKKIHVRLWEKLQILGGLLSPIANIVGAVSPALTGGWAAISIWRSRKKKNALSGGIS
jgi:hypothetical protein